MTWKNLLFLIVTLTALAAVCARAAVFPESVSVSEAGGEGEEDTPVVMEAMERPPLVGAERPWTPPNYSGQEKSLGWTPGVFGVPAGMEERVAFWVDIYTKYTTDQGLLHDSKYISLVYQTLDFSDIKNDTRARRKRVKEAKKVIAARLEKLGKLKSSEGLEGEDLKLYQLFSNIDEPNKFREAALRGRLRFQLGQRDRFMEGVYQSGRNISEMEEIFRREGLPIELTRLPFVESSFNLKARSKVGASGIWQFMRSTARAYVRMDSSADERNDPLHATRAAARKLRNNFEMLQNWPLAITGWNHGPSGVQRLVRKFKTTDIVELTDVRKGRFGFASANFFASFIAAVQVEQNAEKHFGPLKRMPEMRAPELALDRPLAARQLVEWFGGDLLKAQDYNPHIRSHVWKSGVIQRRNFIRVLPDKLAQVETELKSPQASQPAAAADRSKLASSDSAAEPETSHVVEEGETLGDIARRYGVKVSVIQELNGIDDPRSLRAKQKLIIPANSN